MSGTPRRVAVIGSGVAGLTAAHELARTSTVTLFEADDRLGGHADTHDVDGLHIDTGFIVHNERTYPTLLRLFAELGIETQPSEMSMSISSPELEWAGALGARGVLPTRKHATSPRYLRMLTEIPRFHRAAKRLLEAPEDDRDETLAAFLARHRFDDYFARHFMEPLVAAVWSCDPDTALEYPARYLMQFLSHHGMLSVYGSPQWRTVTGGSKRYVEKVAAGLDEVRTGTKITAVTEEADGVAVTDGNGRTRNFDAVVIATHPHQALAMLTAPTAAQREVLSAITYTPNRAVLHTDTSLLPREQRTWASWNFRRVEDGRGLVVSYDLTRLMRLRTRTHYLVTLGAEDLIDPERVIATREYEHPLYTPTSVAAQRRLPEIATDRIAFAGAWHGWGFHEDGARSGVEAAARLGAAEVPVTGGFTVTVRHRRRTPLRHEFSHRVHTAVVDVDDLPDHGRRRAWKGSFEARDHLGDPDRTIRQNVEAFLAREGVDFSGGRILMAAAPRAFGRAFNPISVFWCLADDGAVAATVVEVHNTYGDRHAYLVDTDEHGRGTVDKQMYVSPFHGTDGRYEVVAPVPTAARGLLVSVTLTTDDGETYLASMAGPRTGPDTSDAAREAVRTSARIRRHGISLWARGLKVRPRPPHRQEGVQ